MSDDKTLHEQADEHKVEAAKEKAAGAMHDTMGKTEEAVADLGDKAKEGMEHVKDAVDDAVHHDH